MSRLHLSALGAAALLVGSSTVSAAQKGQGASHMARPAAVHRAKPSHDAAHDAAKVEAKERKETPKDEAKEVKAAEKTEVKDTKADAKKAERIEERGEKASLRDAHEQSSRLLHGVKLTSAERRRVNEIDRKYEAQLKALKKDEHAADKAGTSDAAYEQKVAALAAQERADIRAVVPVSQQARFDANAAALATAKH
jgi:hypothetical protein